MLSREHLESVSVQLTKLAILESPQALDDYVKQLQLPAGDVHEALLCSLWALGRTLADVLAILDLSEFRQIADKLGMALPADYSEPT